MATEAKKTNKKHRRQVQLAMAAILLFAIVFLPTALIFCIGLVPAFVAFFVDPTSGKFRAITVGSFNLIGCMPFVLDLWSSGNDLDKAIAIILDPLALVIVYSAAGFGYVVDWLVSTVVSSILYQKGLLRQKEIQKRQEKLLERWGGDVKRDGLS